MNPGTRSRWGLAIVLAAVCQAGFSQSLEFTPSQPIADQLITVTFTEPGVFFYCTGAPWQLAPVSGNTITLVSMVPPPGAITDCRAIPSPLPAYSTATTFLGPLPAGNYTVVWNIYQCQSQPCQQGTGTLLSSYTVPLAVAAAPPFDADQFALTGSWYNPPTSGQGLELEVYPDVHGAGSALLSGGWFTYDAAGNPQWVTLQGNLAASHGPTYFLAIGTNVGGNFNAPPITHAMQAGTASLTFNNCTDADLTYQFNDGRTGSIALVRLTPATACSNAVPAVSPAASPPNYVDVLHSGNWYDPATSGQGLLVDVVPSINTFFAAWYTYPPESEGLGPFNQRWFTLQDNAYTPGDLHLDSVPIVVTSGGIFNSPRVTTSVQVGTANVQFTSCNTMTLQYDFTQGEFKGLSGTIHEQAIDPPSGCR